MLYLRDNPNDQQALGHFRAMDDAALRDVLGIPQAAGDAQAVFDILTTQPAYLQAVLERRFDQSFLKEAVRWAIDQFTDQMHPLTLLWTVWHVIHSDNNIRRREQAEAMRLLGLLPPIEPKNESNHDQQPGSDVIAKLLANDHGDEDTALLGLLRSWQRNYAISQVASAIFERGERSRGLQLAYTQENEVTRANLLVQLVSALDDEIRHPLLAEILGHIRGLGRMARVEACGKLVQLLPIAESEALWQEIFQVAMNGETETESIHLLAKLVVVTSDAIHAQAALETMLNRIASLSAQPLPDDVLTEVCNALAAQDHPETVAYVGIWLQQVIVPMEPLERIRRLNWQAVMFAQQGRIELALACASYIRADAVHSEPAYLAIVAAMAERGPIDDAMQLADTLDLYMLRPMALNQIALILARRNDPRAVDVFETAYESFEAPSDGSALQEIALWLARHDQLDLAYQVIREPFVSRDMEEDFVTALHKQTIKIALEANDIQAAIVTSRFFKLGTIYHVEALETIAAKAATLHGLAAAREVMAESHPEATQNGAWREVGIALVKRGEFEDAQQVAAMLRAQNEQKPPSDPFAFWGILMNVVGEATGTVEDTNAKFADMKGQWQESHQRDYEARETKSFEEYPAAIDRAIVGALTQQDRLREALVIARRLRYPEHRVEGFQAIIAALPASHPQLNSILGDMLMDARQVDGPAARRKALMQVMILMIEKGRFEQVLSLRSTLNQTELVYAIPLLKALAPELAIGLQLGEPHQSDTFGELVDELLNKEQLEAVRQIIPSLSGLVHGNIERMLRLAREFAKRGRWTDAYATLEEFAERDMMSGFHTPTNFLEEVMRWDLPPATLMEVLRIAGWGRLRWRRIHRMINEVGPLQ